MQNNVQYVSIATKSPRYFGPKEPAMKKHNDKNSILLMSQSILIGLIWMPNLILSYICTLPINEGLLKWAKIECLNPNA